MLGKNDQAKKDQKLMYSTLHKNLCDIHKHTHEAVYAVISQSVRNAIFMKELRAS